jgi:hypothetical protein
MIPRNIKQLPTSGRSIRFENASALKRRWRLMQDGALDDPKDMKRLFPDQRDFMELLEVLSEEEVDSMADCGTPLFGFQFRCADYNLDALARNPLGDLEAASCTEAFLALASRLDAIRTSVQQACLVFNLSVAEASWLSRFCPQELNLLARDRSMQLVPMASLQYFMASATRSLTNVEKTVLGSVSRGGRIPALA